MKDERIARIEWVASTSTMDYFAEQMKALRAAKLAKDAEALGSEHPQYEVLIAEALRLIA